MVTFANLGSVRLPSLKFVGLRVQKIRRIQCVSFMYRSPHFCFSWRRPCDYQQCVAQMERQFNACQTPRSMYLSIFNSFRVIRCLSQCVSPKIANLTHFCFPQGRPWGNHAKCIMDGKRIRCLQIVSLHVPMFSSLSAKRLCVFGLNGAVQILIFFFCLHPSLYLLVS